MSVVIKTNTGAWQTAIDRAADIAAAALAEQIKNDSDMFVPKDLGDLRTSGRVDKGKSGERYVVWDTVYARRQWFGVGITNYTTAGTGSQWVEKAKAKYNHDWQIIAQKRFSEGLK